MCAALPIDSWRRAALGLGILCAATGLASGGEPANGNGPQSAKLSILVIDGLTLPSRQVERSFSVPGILTSRPVEVGQFVAEGQLIAELDTELEKVSVRTSRLRAESPHEIRAAEVDEMLKNEDLERKRELSLRDSVSNWELRQAELALELARARHGVVRSQQRIFEEELARDEALLTQRQAKAPFAGWIWRTYREEGEAVDARQPVVMLVALDPLWVEVNVPAEHAGGIRPGQEAGVTVLGQVRSAVVGSVEPVVDAGSATFRVRIVVPNQDHAIVAGVSATATIALTGVSPAASGTQAKLMYSAPADGKP